MLVPSGKIAGYHTTAPVFNPSSCSQGTHPATALSVGLSTTTSGAQMRFTKDGSTPSSTNGSLIAGTSGTAVIAAGQECTLKAVAFKTGYNTSPVTSGYFDRTDPNGGGHAPQHDRRRDTNQTTSTRVVSYTLDNCGNRTSVVDAGVSKSYVPNSLNEYTTGHGSAVTNGVSHEISSYNGTSYNYIGDTYLAKATAGTNTCTLYYDALGRCVKRTSFISGVSTTNYYLFDGEHWIMEWDSSGVNKGNALYGNGMDELIARANNYAPVGKQGQWFFPDRNGNISVVLDGTGAVLESYRYDAFGLPSFFDSNRLPLSGGTAIANRFLFTGREWNPTFGFYEYRARAYNPTIGRFMSEDPKGFEAGDYNLYRYCANDPLDLADPMGLDTARDFVAGVDDFALFGLGGRIANALSSSYEASVDRSSTAFRLGQLGGLIAGVADGATEVRGLKAAVTGEKLLPAVRRTVTDRLVQHTTIKDLTAAAKEAKTGVQEGGQHLKEVSEAARGLRERIKAINQGLSNPELSKETREALTGELAKASKNLDAAEQALQGRFQLHGN